MSHSIATTAKCITDAQNAERCLEVGLYISKRKTKTEMINIARSTKRNWTGLIKKGEALGFPLFIVRLGTNLQCHFSGRYLKYQCHICHRACISLLGNLRDIAEVLR